MNKIAVVMFLLEEVSLEISKVDGNKVKIADYLKMVRRLTLEVEKELEVVKEKEEIKDENL